MVRNVGLCKQIKHIYLSSNLKRKECQDINALYRIFLNGDVSPEPIAHSQIDKAMFSFATANNLLEKKSIIDKFTASECLTTHHSTKGASEKEQANDRNRPNEHPNAGNRPQKHAKPDAFSTNRGGQYPLPTQEDNLAKGAFIVFFALSLLANFLFIINLLTSKTKNHSKEGEGKLVTETRKARTPPIQKKEARLTTAINASTGERRGVSFRKQLMVLLSLLIFLFIAMLRKQSMTPLS